jgi:hypothetical protein
MKRKAVTDSNTVTPFLHPADVALKHLAPEHWGLYSSLLYFLISFVRISIDNFNQKYECQARLEMNGNLQEMPCFR